MFFGECINLTAAQAAHEKNLSMLDGAGKEEQGISRLHAMVSQQFINNLASPFAANNLLAAIGQLQAAVEKRKTAEQAAKGSQATLAAAQQKLDAANQQAMGPLKAEVKKEIEQRQKEAKL